MFMPFQQLTHKKIRVGQADLSLNWLKPKTFYLELFGSKQIQNQSPALLELKIKLHFQAEVFSGLEASGISELG